MKPKVCKVDGVWQVHRPGYGFNRDEVRRFRTWKAALRSLRSAPGSANCSQVSFAANYRRSRGYPSAARVGEAS